MDSKKIMSATKRKKILVKQRRYQGHDCNYSVTSTLLNVPKIGTVIVPWLVLKADPTGVNKVFQKHQGQITYDDWVNIFMAAPDLRGSIFGSLDEFSQTWIIKVETPRDLSDIIYRLTSFPTVVRACLRSNSAMQKSADIPVIVMLQPKANCIESLIKKLQSVTRRENSTEKFYFEVDLASSVKRWAAIVLKEDLTVRGARFAVGNGAPYNHMFDWQNVFCCVPCIPCCLVASPLYRIQRRLRYKQSLEEKEEPMVIVGAQSSHPEDQGNAIRHLMAWARSGGVPSRCRRCGQFVRSCLCKTIQDPPPVIIPMAPDDTLETKEMQNNRMHTLRDIKQFNDNSRNNREGRVSIDDETVSRDSVRPMVNGDSTSPRDVSPSVTSRSGSSLRSSGTFSIGDLRVFSIAAHNKIHPIDEEIETVTPRHKSEW